MTRLLKTAIIGRCAKAVDSSRIDIEAGLSGLNIRRTPPGFWAWAAPAVPNTASKASDAISRRSLGVMTRLLRYRSRGEAVEAGPSCSTRVLFRPRFQIRTMAWRLDKE